MSVDAEFVKTIAAVAIDFETDAERLDTSGPGNRYLRFNISRLARMGYFGAGIPKAYGGMELASSTLQQCNMLIAEACGITAFTQQQLHAGGSYVGNAENEETKQRLLPSLADGTVLCGIAFSHLRRAGAAAVTASKVNGGWKINGEAPWVTGWRFLDAFVLGATTHDGHFVYFYVPIAEFSDFITASPPIRLVTMDAGDTVRVTIANLTLPNRYCLFERDGDHMTRSDYCGITSHVWLPLGCALGSVRQLRALAERTQRKSIAGAADRLAAQIEQCKADALTWSAHRADQPEYKANALRTRAKAIDVALRASQAAIAAGGGSSHLPDNPAQRRLREASFYIIAAQTPDIQGAFLEVSSDGSITRQ